MPVEMSKAQKGKKVEFNFCRKKWNPTQIGMQATANQGLCQPKFFNK